MNHERVAKQVFFTEHIDPRGKLIFGQSSGLLPIDFKRFFTITNVPTRAVRGEHAHLQCHQLLIAVQGSLEVEYEDSEGKHTLILDRGTMGLYLPPLVWAKQSNFSVDCILLVLASDPYDADDYIHEHADFVRIIESIKF